MDLFKRIWGDKTEKEPVKGTEGQVEPQQVTGRDFDEVVLKSELPTVVDFWAEWCGPCHMIAPSVQTLANEFSGRVQVTKLNADEYPEILGRYGIMGIPTLIYFKGGKEVDRVVGLTAYAVLKGKVEKLLT